MTGGIIIPIWVAFIAAPLVIAAGAEVIRLGRKVVELDARLRALEPKGGGDD